MSGLRRTAPAMAGARGWLGLVLAVGVAAGGLLGAEATPAAAREAYVMHSISGFYAPGAVTPFDTATNLAGPAIPVGVGAFGIAIAPDGKMAYATDTQDDTVTPINTATNTAQTPIAVTQAPNFDGVAGIAITPNGTTAWVVGYVGSNLTPIDLATGTVGTPIHLPDGDEPQSIAITPNGSSAYVRNWYNPEVLPVDLATGTQETPISLCPNNGFCFVESLAITPDGKTAYVAGNGVVTPVNLVTGTAGTPIQTGGGGEIANSGPGTDRGLHGHRRTRRLAEHLRRVGIL